MRRCRRRTSLRTSAFHGRLVLHQPRLLHLDVRSELLDLPLANLCANSLVIASEQGLDDQPSTLLTRRWLGQTLIYDPSQSVGENVPRKVKTFAAGAGDALEHRLQERKSVV